jgi:HSP20 family protein
MANSTTPEQQVQRSQTGQQQQGKESGREQQRGVARRGGYDPFGFSLMPSEMFFLNPFSLMRRMTEEVDRAFNQSVRGGTDADVLWVPAVETDMRDGKYIVRAELAGLKPDDVRVEVTDGALAIEGERKDEREENRGGERRTERRYGRFYRTIPLPEGAQLDEVRARFENGVLEVTVPVASQRSNTRQIPIEGGSKTSG